MPDSSGNGAHGLHFSTQKEEATCLGSVLTTPDVAYVFSNSQLSTPEEGNERHPLYPYFLQNDLCSIITCNWFVPFPDAFFSREDQLLLRGTSVCPSSVRKLHFIQRSHQKYQVLWWGLFHFVFVVVKVEFLPVFSSIPNVPENFIKDYSKFVSKNRY